jgi:hypothetical protein
MCLERCLPRELLHLEARQFAALPVPDHEQPTDPMEDVVRDLKESDAAVANMLKVR